MAKKRNSKISKIKRNNQTSNKMKKQGKLKLQRHKQKVQKQNQPSQPQVEYSSESESGSGEEWADMLDEEEQQYILSRLSKQPQLLSNVPEKDQESQNKSRKRKKIDKGKVPKRRLSTDSGAESDDEDVSDVEEKYEKELSERPPKKMRPLLPIKTKEGVIERQEEYEESESEPEQEGKDTKTREEDEDSDAGSLELDSDSGVDGTAEENEGEKDGEVVSAVELLAARRDRLQNDKLRIGALCSSLLEAPERKLKNLYPILYLMEERLRDGTLALQSVRKLATLSAFEVFKDILPDYYIRHQDYSKVKLKKDTLALYKYEKELLEFYKRYLQRLEKAAMVLRKKRGDTRQLDSASESLALVSLRCLSGLLSARPRGNFAPNIAQSVVPFLGCRHPAARDIVSGAISDTFAEDHKGDITLTIVRLINQLVKRQGSRLQPEALSCLLSLRIRDVDLDAEADAKHKRKVEEKHKKRIVNLSKKEKKRAKKLKEVERELLETEAREDEVARRGLLAEVTKTVFHIYFRVLKQSPYSKLLTAALEGICKFTHVINLEFYSDLVKILVHLVDDEQLSSSLQLQCARAALAVLAGTGDALNLDPAAFHRRLYVGALAVHAGSSNEDAKIVIDAISQVASRARRVSAGVLQAFGKRAAACSALLPPHAALAALRLLHLLSQQSKPVAQLLENTLEGEGGSGKFEPLLQSPEHCNAHCAALHELCALRAHFHPAVRTAAEKLLKGHHVEDFKKMTPIQIFESYDCSQMAFKPAIPPPKAIENAKNKLSTTHAWAQPDFKLMCENIENNIDMVIKKS